MRDIIECWFSSDLGYIASEISAAGLHPWDERPDVDDGAMYCATNPLARLQSAAITLLAVISPHSGTRRLDTFHQTPSQIHNVHFLCLLLLLLLKRTAEERAHLHLRVSSARDQVEAESIRLGALSLVAPGQQRVRCSGSSNFTRRFWAGVRLIQFAYLKTTFS